MSTSSIENVFSKPLTMAHIGVELAGGGEGDVSLAELLREGSSPPPEDFAILTI